MDGTVSTSPSEPGVMMCATSSPLTTGFDVAGGPLTALTQGSADPDAMRCFHECQARV